MARLEGKEEQLKGDDEAVDLLNLLPCPQCRTVVLCNYTSISCFIFYDKWCDVNLLSASVIVLHAQLSSSLCSAGVVLVPKLIILKALCMIIPHIFYIKLNGK